MTKAQMFTAAHKQARIEHRQYGGAYRDAFGNALRGFHMVVAGFRGVQIIELALVWA